DPVRRLRAGGRVRGRLRAGLPPAVPQPAVPGEAAPRALPPRPDRLTQRGRHVRSATSYTSGSLSNHARSTAMVTTTQESVSNKPLRARARIGAGGRLVIPVEMRRALGLEEGEPVNLRVEDGELHIWTVSEGIRQAQELARPYIRPGVSVIDE